MIFVCLHVHTGTQAWECFTARDRAQLTTVRRFTVGRKTTGFYVLSCTDLFADTPPPPPLPFQTLSPVSFSLALASKDLCGPRRQESLILRPGGPYTVLLHILHAYAAGHRERLLCRGDSTHSQQGIALLSIRGDVNHHPIGANSKLRHLDLLLESESLRAEQGPIVEPN